MVETSVKLNTKGQLNDIERFSFVDGPGNRFVIFLQGCNFNCKACHNPYTINDCDHCGICVEPCPENALFIQADEVILAAELCTECDDCIKVCPIDSTPLSREVSVAQMLEEIRAVSNFISGITVSGGEATLQADFVFNLFAAIKADNELSRLSCFIDSNGSADLSTWDKLLQVSDGAMIDLKVLDEKKHIELTDVGNEKVLESIKYLAKKKRLYEVRLLIVAAQNDTDKEILETAQWLYDVDKKMRLKIIAFRQHGVREQYQFEEPDKAKIDRIADIFRSVGLDNLELVY